MRTKKGRPVLTAPPDDAADFWALLSGGKDSVVTAHVLAERGELRGCVYLDTGISTPDVRPFVERLCRDQGWPLKVYRTPIEYEWLVGRFGFPGPAGHGIAMNYLKGRPIRAFIKEHPNAILASGVRMRESSRRMGTAREWSRLEGAWCHAPILEWSTERVWAHLRKHDLDVSPAYWNLHISGDCLCGAFARREETFLVEMFYPDLAVRIRALEDSRRRVSSVRCRWGGGPGFDGKQTRLERYLCSECAWGGP